MTELGIGTERLLGFIERIERLETERSSLGEDVTEVFSEAKAMGLNVKAMRVVIKLRKLDKSDRDEQQHIVDLYTKALEM